MSIVVESAEGIVSLFSKGSDETMLQRCDLSPEKREKIKTRIDKMASRSYRTMVMAMRTLDHTQVDQFNQLWALQKKTNDSQDQFLMQSIFEKDLIYLGTTAVEDTL